MSRQTLRIVLSAVAGLLIVPVAINIGTGGDAPPWLKPFVNWLWPIAIACVALVIALELWDKREQISTHRHNDPRNVDLALTQVTRYVTARQRGTLGEQLRIALALDERPGAVRQPTHLVQRVSGEEFQLSPDLTIADVFAELNESMLILGAPGAGKTTQLLDLAQALIAQARSSTNPSIPAVLDLSDWVLARRQALRRRRTTFDAWILESLAERYRIPERVGRIWLTDNRLTLLLDGLDEVPEGERELCAMEINALQQRFGLTRVAVCSREADYSRLTTRLRLQGAVVIRPLDRAAVQDYLAAVSPALAGVVAALEGDEQLWDLLTTPLMLTIMIFAQADRSARALATAAEPADRRRTLFDAYIVEVLARRRSNEIDDPSRILRAIKTLAVASTRTDAGVRVAPLDAAEADRFLPDGVKHATSVWIGPFAVTASALGWTWASAVHFGQWTALMSSVIGFLAMFVATSFRELDRVERRFALLGVLLAAVAVPFGLATGMRALLSAAGSALTLIGVSLFLLALLWLVAAAIRDTTVTTEPQDYVAVVAAGVLGPGGVVLLGLRPLALQSWALTFILGLCLTIGMMTALGFGERAARLGLPATHIGRVLWGVYVLAGALLVFGGVSGRRGGAFWEPAIGLLVGLIYALVLGTALFIWAAGAPVIRVAMIIAGEPNPWRRAFLRFAADRSLLTHTDGGYRFIHLLIRDHLAECEPQRLGDAVARRRAELPERDLRPIGG